MKSSQNNWKNTQCEIKSENFVLNRWENKGGVLSVKRERKVFISQNTSIKKSVKVKREKNL